MIKISVITVVLNGISKIEQTIKSVIDQSYPDIEYIIVDGGSTDGTVDIIRKYEDHISYWVSEPDEGTYFAMNKGLEKATGDYVYYLNAGDTLIPEVLKKIAEYLELYRADVLYGNIVHKKYGKRIPLPLDAIHWQMPVCHQGVFVKRTVTDRFDTRYRLAADYKLLYEKYRMGSKFVYIPIDISYYEAGGLSDDSVNSCRERTSVAAEMLDMDSDDFALYREVIIDNYIEKKFEIIMSGSDNTDILDDFVGDCFDRNLNIVMFGTGDIADRSPAFIERLKPHIKYFTDNDRNKWGKTFYNVNIVSPEKLSREKNIYIVIMNERYCEIIRKQLLGMGLDETVTIEDYLDLKELFKANYKQRIIEEGMNEISNLKRLYEK